MFIINYCKNIIKIKQNQPKYFDWISYKIALNLYSNKQLYKSINYNSWIIKIYSKKMEAIFNYF